MNPLKVLNNIKMVIPVLLIALVICSVPSDAQEVKRDCSSSCECPLQPDDTVIMNCTGRNHIGTGASCPVNTVSILFGSNDLHTLDKDGFNYANVENVKNLSLKGSKIEKIEQGAFNGLSNVERIDLSDNLISSVNVTVLRDLTTLKEIDFRGNRNFHCKSFEKEFTSQINRSLTVLCDDCTPNCECTKKQSGGAFVDCQDQGLTSPPSCYPNNTNIIWLGYNRIEILRNNLFKYLNLAGLFILKLNNNSIFVIEEDAFAGLDGLRTLDLSFNLITSLSSEICSKPNFEEINLTGNIGFDCESFKRECFKKQQKHVTIHCDAASKTPEVRASTSTPAEDGMGMQDTTSESPEIDTSPYATPEVGKDQSGLNNTANMTGRGQIVGNDRGEDDAPKDPISTSTAEKFGYVALGAVIVLMVVGVVVCVMYRETIMKKICPTQQKDTSRDAVVKYTFRNTSSTASNTNDSTPETA